MAIRREAELIDMIAQHLTNAGLRFIREPSLGGLRPNFLVYGPEETPVVVEAKGWRDAEGNIARAREQAQKYAEIAGTQHALIVLWEISRNYWDWGVVGIDGLIPALTKIFQQDRPTRSVVQPQPGDGRTVFAAMPFDREYDDTFFVAMTYAADQVGAAAVRVDKEEFVGDIVQEIRRQISDCSAIIIDLSDSRPNVLYEAGYAHALDKPSVHICSTSLGALPFDVRNWNTIHYHRGRTTVLRDALAARLAAVI